MELTEKRETMQREKSRLELYQIEKKKQQKYLLILVLAGCLVIFLFGVLLQKAQSEEELLPVDSVDQTKTENRIQNEEQEMVQIPVLADEDGWKVRLVNGTTLLEEGYVPELVTVNSAGYQFDARAADALRSMLQAAKEAGLSPMICSSYRSWERQSTLFAKQVEKQQNMGLSYEDAYEKAKTVVAFPGTSEHQTGLAADLVATSHQLLDDSQEQTAEQQWLMEHCWEYGFILRYPKNKSEITGIIYEPWHYRYVGNEVAEYIHENDLCLEEYWERLEEF